MDDGGSDDRVERAIRWRLILGRHADADLSLDKAGGGAAGDGGAGHSEDLASILTEARALDMPLNYIYDREHQDRLNRGAGPGGTDGLSVPRWLHRVRELFPSEAVQVMEQDALTRYGLTELVTDAEVLEQATPNDALLKAILQFKHLMKGEVLEAARRVVRQVVEALRQRLETECQPALHGPIQPGGRPPIPSFKNADWRRTIRRNLKNYDTERERLMVDRIYYQHRTRQRSPWRIIMAVDQSGSMTDSLIHASVMAAIFAGLPSVDVRLVLWDHRVVDVSHLAHDPLEVLMGCQLGGGTRMIPALRYCETLITEPRQTLFCLLSDWYVFGEKQIALAEARKLAEAGVRCVGLSALDAECRPVFDEGFARELAGCGWFVAAMTPKKLAEYVGKMLA